MQGIFDPLPDGMSVVSVEGAKSEGPTDSGRVSRESKEYREFKRFQQFKEAKRSRLDAMNNVPWRNLEPANDRDTERRMQEHKEREWRYDAMTDRQKEMKPRVAPYPETPDRVFPGVPCYKLLVDGVYRYVFVLSPDGGWDGEVRAQTRPY